MYVKGFDKNLCCRGMQFEVGKEYKIETDKPLKLCTNTVFHFCDSIQKVHEYYSCAKDNRFCEIQVLGDIVTDNAKCGSNHIKILREFTGDELDILLGKTNGNTGLFNSGDQNSGDQNSGDQNSGYQNSGDQNSGHWNSGDQNSGHWNSGYRNSGYRNSGDRNSGDRNSGIFNSCNNSSGIFCSIEPKARIFNIETDMTISDFYNSKYYSAIISSPFDLTEWVEYTKEEKNDAKRATGGYLKKYEYKDACAEWWKKMSPANKKIIMSMPNFNSAIFKEITGIEVKQ